jgi:hypothetical protein
MYFSAAEEKQLEQRTTQATRHPGWHAAFQSSSISREPSCTPAATPSALLALGLRSHIDIPVLSTIFKHPVDLKKGGNEDSREEPARQARGLFARSSRQEDEVREVTITNCVSTDTTACHPQSPRHSG